MLIALILKLAGVDDEIVAQEYQLTEVGLGPMREEIVQHLLGYPSTGGERGKALNMSGARLVIRSCLVCELRSGGIANKSGH